MSLSGGASRGVEHFSCPEHAVHDNRKLPGDRHRSALEAQPLAQLQPPAPETAFVPGPGSREKHCCRFIQQSPQMAGKHPAKAAG